MHDSVDSDHISDKGSSHSLVEFIDHVVGDVFRSRAMEFEDFLTVRAVGIDSSELEARTTK